MKKLLFCILFLLISVDLVSASSGHNEEDACFILLNEAVKEDIRFQDYDSKEILKSGDLSEVLFSEKGAGGTVDFSTYESFNKYREQENGEERGGVKGFYARRNNIGTIVAAKDFIISRIGGFGKDTNFTFPLSDSGTTSFGTKYELGDGKTFKEYLVYTHHLINGEFLSCGMVKVKPLGENNFTTITEDKYFTNTLNGNDCTSGFEGEKVLGEPFYRMKSNICVKDYSEEDLLKMEVISIAYDNKSDYFNEYITHPLQVQAMKDNSANSKGLVGVMEYFRDLVDRKTCLELIHTELPYRCKKPNKNFSLLDFLIPKAEARLDLNYTPEEKQKVEREMQEARGMVMYENIPYELYKKIDLIPDENFREYLRMAMVPGLEKWIIKRKEQGIVITPFEEVFLGCNLDYKKRTDIIIDFLKKLDPKKFDINNLSYSDKNFGNCIIPYPDKENLDKVIEGSFDSNQLYAKQLNGTYKPEADSEEVRKFVEEMNKISIERENQLNELSKKFNEGIIDIKEFEIEKKSIFDLYDKKELSIIEKQNKKTENLTGSKENNMVEKGKNLGDFSKYILPIVLFLLGLGIIIISVILRNKKNNK